MSAKPNLRAVPKVAPVEPPSVDYEWQQRQASARKNWSALHIASDKRSPIFIAQCVRRLWR